MTVRAHLFLRVTPDLRIERASVMSDEEPTEMNIGTPRARWLKIASATGSDFEQAREELLRYLARPHLIHIFKPLVDQIRREDAKVRENAVLQGTRTKP